MSILAELTRFEWRYLLAVLDVLIVSLIFYRVLVVIRGTRAAPMLWGLVLVVLLYLVARQTQLHTLGWLLGNFLSSIILVIVVVFQDEIRRGLTKMGLQRFVRRPSRHSQARAVEELTLVARSLANDRLGAILVIQRKVGLDEFLEDSVVLDAALNRKLLYSIFIKDSPLHDGAVLIEGERIRAAGCVLPLSFNPDLDPNLGTRHRAALGLSERSDALVIIVSEETGAISVATEGRLTRNLDPSQLRDLLTNALVLNGDKPDAGLEAKQ